MDGGSRTRWVMVRPSDAARLSAEALVFVRMGYAPGELVVAGYPVGGGVLRLEVVPRTVTEPRPPQN